MQNSSDVDSARPEDSLAPPQQSASDAWISRAANAPYFVDEHGCDWTPIGHNDAVTWPSLSGILRGRNLPLADAYLGKLAASGVTCLRLMLEYAQTSEGLFEKPVGCFRPHMVQAWDALFRLCNRHGMRILLTPFDTFWTWRRWRTHPYNRANGGHLDHPSRLLLCRQTREAIKARLSFAVERWGGSGTLFAWDLWNEIHPGQAEDSIECFGEFISDLSTHVRRRELSLYGRSHPQTVSLFGPEIDWRPHMDFRPAIFQHPDLDFASIHIYREGTIDDPRDTVQPALDMAEIVAASIGKITDDRPFFDSEHGPIHRFKDHKTTLSPSFDDEYFRHMQWAHLAAGGAGGGMRWPNRSPHLLTEGMHRAQRTMADFLPQIQWQNFSRQPWTGRISLSSPQARAVACSDARQAVIWLVRTDTLTKRGMLSRAAKPLRVEVSVPGMESGAYTIVQWDTRSGGVRAQSVQRSSDTPLRFSAILHTDSAAAIRKTA